MADYTREEMREWAKGERLLEYCGSGNDCKMALMLRQCLGELESAERREGEWYQIDIPRQEIARELGIGLGETIHDQILPGIVALKAKLQASEQREAGLREVAIDALSWHDVFDDPPPEFKQLLVKLKDGKSETAHRCGIAWISTAGEVEVTHWRVLGTDGVLHKIQKALASEGDAVATSDHKCTCRRGLGRINYDCLCEGDSK